MVRDRLRNHSMHTISILARDEIYNLSPLKTLPIRGSVQHSVVAMNRLQLIIEF